MTDQASEYVDVREVLPNYEQVPCRHCDVMIWADAPFRHHHNHAFCDDHGPDVSHLFSSHVEVP